MGSLLGGTSIFSLDVGTLHLNLLMTSDEIQKWSKAYGAGSEEEHRLLQEANATLQKIVVFYLMRPLDLNT